MKTNEIASGKDPVINPSHLPETIGTPAIPQLSENAFYLIALVSLLRKSMDSVALQKLLVPGQCINYGDTPTVF